MSLPVRIVSLCLVLCLFLPALAFAENEALTQEELTDLLYEFSREDEDGGQFTVLPDDYVEPITGIEGIYHLLIAGVDTSGQGISGRSDTMILAILNTRQKTVKLISFMRDLYVKIPGRGHSRLNAAYAYGGPDLLVKTIRQVFQVRVDGYLAVDFELMAKLIDAVGGIEMDVGEREFESLNAILSYYNRLHDKQKDEGLLLSSGRVLLTGPQAMAYARIRKMDSDFERVKRQQNTLRSVFNKILSMDASEIGELVTQFASEVKTDVTLAEAFELIALVFQMGEAQISSLTIPVSGAYKHVTKNKAALLVPNLKKNLNALRAFVSESGAP